MIRDLLAGIGSLVAWCGFILGIRKEVTVENLHRAFPLLSNEERHAIAKKTYLNLGRVFGEMLYLRFGSLKGIKHRTVVTNPEVFHNSLRQGKGLIVVAGHYANWEWLALGGSLQLQSQFAIVRKNLPSSFSEQFLEHLRIRSGNILINSGDVRSMIRTIREGKCLAILADQTAPSESVAVDFLGIRSHTYEGPAWLALSTGAVMLFASCTLGHDRKYLITFHPIEISPDETIQSLTQKHAKILESEIRNRPELWLWQHRRWKWTH